MIWIATMKDGSIISQYEGGKKSTTEMLKGNDNLSRFKITESSNDSVVQFSADSGVMKFSNLDYSKLQELVGGEKLNLVFDKHNEVFKLDKESIDLVHKICLKDTKDYMYIEFDQNGYFNVSGQLLYMGVKLPNGEDLPFIANPPYNDFKYLIDANNDFYMNNKTPIKKHDYIVRHTLILNKQYEVGDGLMFDVSHSIVLDIMKGTIMLNSMVKASKEINTTLYTVFGSSREANPISFSVNSPVPIRKVLTIL